MLCKGFTKPDYENVALLLMINAIQIVTKQIQG